MRFMAGDEQAKAVGEAAGRELKEQTPVQTRHEATIRGQKIAYDVTTGLMPLRNAKDEIEAQIFFVAYTLEREDDDVLRPLTFAFNGGPGSSSVWLHMGALGPKRAHLNADGTMPPPPFRLVDNDETWLTETDLVFIDPVGTGYSRAATP
ncbi:MAG TPA: peptidase S10, partial [Chloroflexi bacterium]|nr:peptidase S10 [Chloroflexota bacterium]